MKNTITSKAVVTGGLGFVGRNLIDSLIVTGLKNIVVIDDCSNSNSQLPKLWQGRMRHVKISVVERGWLSELDDADVVYHLACKTLLECDNDPIYDAVVNSGSTLMLLEYLRHLSAKPTVVFTSSACVYGLTPRLKVNELYPTNPTSAYGVSKLAAEKYVQMYAQKFSLNTVVLRLSNVYGPWQNSKNPYCGVIGKFLDQAINGAPLTIIGDGSQTRDFTHVMDVVDALIMVADPILVNGSVFNISYGKDISVQELAALIIGEYDGSQTVTVPARSIDDIKHRCLDNTKLAKVVKLQKTPVKLGLQKTIAWKKKTTRLPTLNKMVQ